MLSSTVDMLGERLEWVENVLEKHVNDEFEHVKVNTIETDTRFAHLEEMVMGAVQVLRECLKEMRTLIKGMEEDLVLCKRVATNEELITEARPVRIEYPSIEIQCRERRQGRTSNGK